jgi:hypothetical protein
MCMFGRGLDSARGLLEDGEEAGEIFEERTDRRGSPSRSRGRLGSPASRGRDQRRSPLPDCSRRHSPARRQYSPPRRQYSPAQSRSPRRRRYSPETGTGGTAQRSQRPRSTSRRRATADRAGRRPRLDRDPAGENCDELRSTRQASSSGVAAAETPEELARRKEQRADRDIAECIADITKATAAVGVPDVIKYVCWVLYFLLKASKDGLRPHRLVRYRMCDCEIM